MGALSQEKHFDLNKLYILLNVAWVGTVSLIFFFMSIKKVRKKRAYIKNKIHSTFFCYLDLLLCVRVPHQGLMQPNQGLFHDLLQAPDHLSMEKKLFNQMQKLPMTRSQYNQSMFFAPVVDVDHKYYYLNLDNEIGPRKRSYLRKFKYLGFFLIMVGNFYYQPIEDILNYFFDLQNWLHTAWAQEKYTSAQLVSLKLL